MPTTALADVTDLGDWLGESITEDGDVRRAKWLLRRATSLVLETCGRVAHPWTPADVPGGVQEIILSCAARAYVNPESWNYERLDDWMGGGKPVPEDGLYLTPTEKKSLLLYIEDAPRAAWVSWARTARCGRQPRTGTATLAGSTRSGTSHEPSACPPSASRMAHG